MNLISRDLFIIFFNCAFVIQKAYALLSKNNVQTFFPSELNSGIAKLSVVV